ncbi:MAG: flotillin family protein [Acidobacteria bacterium]|nr:MAG: flotillin family protein [Acidobacteriota bacterium]REK08877.1 MAG: flotillin family protein [Acidobacteriota bacterium]
MALFYRKVDQGRALVVTRPGKISVSFTPRLVFPMAYRVEEMDISLQTIEIDRRGTEGLICQDNIRADIKVAFFVRVNKTVEDVIRVAQSIGCRRASDHQTLEQLFSAKFSEALKTVGKQLDFVDLYTKREEFRDQIIRVIGRDLNGYILEDAAIDFLEQTPLSSLDEFNILDAQGIRKITELTAREHVRTNEFQNFERKQIKKQDVEAQEAIYELERQQADAEARQLREIATVQAREQAETRKVEAEERLKSESARIRTDEEIAINEENKQRQVEVAKKNRERVVAVENERVEKDRQLEAITRERETELMRIAKEKEIETEKKAIADVIRERVAVDRTVAEEEERIKELRVVEEANRQKKAVIIGAEAEAQEILVKDIKKAEAQEEAAKFKARERLTLADAELQAADKEAQAKIRLAEGIQAEVAASGLAEVRVKEEDAAAVEKQGRAQANVVRETGSAEASAIEAKLTAEAAGIEKKATAMAALDEASREHEEFRLRIEKERAVESEAIDAQRRVAEAQAQVLATALGQANIDIVGGDGAFLDRLVNAISAGKSLDAFVGRSGTVQATLSEYLDGERSLPEDVRQAISGLASSGNAQSLALLALLARRLPRATPAQRDALAKLLEEDQGEEGGGG